MASAWASRQIWPPHQHQSRRAYGGLPSSAVWVLYRNIMRVWRYMFVPATMLVIGGFYYSRILFSGACVDPGP